MVGSVKLNFNCINPGCHDKKQRKKSLPHLLGSVVVGYARSATRRPKSAGDGCDTPRVSGDLSRV